MSSNPNAVSKVSTSLPRAALSRLCLVVAPMVLMACTPTPTASEVSSSPTAPASAAGTSVAGTPAGSVATTSAPAGDASTPAYVAALEREITASMAADMTPGAVVLVRSRSKGDWTGAFGSRQLAAVEPVTTDDVFRLADITATMTATVILQLQEKGKLKLTDPISKYVSGVPGGEDITLDQLGTYETGLYSYDQDPSFRAAYLKDPQKVWTPQELLAISFSHPASFPAGEENYSNTNFILLGLVIEKITGLPAASAFQTMLFDPLQLKHIGLATGGKPLPDPHANGYAFSHDALSDPNLTDAHRRSVADGTVKPLDRTSESASWAWTAGGAYGTAGDVADYFEAMISGPLLTAQAQQARITEMDAIGPDHPEGTQYGFGIARYGQYLTYSGTMPGYSALAAYDPLSGTTIVVLANLMWTPDGGSTVSKIFSAAAAAVGPLDHQPAASAPVPTEAVVAPPTK